VKEMRTIKGGGERERERERKERKSEKFMAETSCER
jgi:hypothetical protein